MGGSTPLDKGGGGGHRDPEISGGGGGGRSPKKFFRPFWLHFRRKIKVGPGPRGPSPGSVTAYVGGLDCGDLVCSRGSTL